MITKTSLDKMWSEIVPQKGQTIGRRADAKHPLDFFVTYDETSNMQLMLLSEFQYKLPLSSKQINVRGNRRKKDNKYAICFSLIDMQLRDQFISLCWDIMECTCSINDEKTGVQMAIRRFKMWQKLFAEANQTTLSELTVKGLIGELAVLKDICIPRYGIAKAISGWIGPMGADRDFEYDDYWLESKYVSFSADKVTISSLDQLDTDREGYLILCRTEKTSSNAVKHITLKQLVDEIAKILESDENTFVAYKNRLALLGYDAQDERVLQAYTAYKFEVYIVADETFPRIKRSKQNAAIVNCEYQLSIPALNQWSSQLV